MASSPKTRISKTKVNYWIDVFIAVGFLASAVSGIVLLFTGSSGGYQGGRNPRYLQNVLLIARTTWKTLHNWSSLIMVAGVALHLALHARWIACMTRILFRKRDAARPAEEACPVEA